MSRVPGAFGALCILSLSLAACGSCGRDESAFPVTGPHGMIPGASTSGRAPHDEPIPTDAEAVFSEHGSGVAFAGERNGRLSLVHNGKPGREYESVGAISLSPDGRRVAYAALVRGEWHMVLDGVEGPAFSELESAAFSQDGRHVVYVARAGEAWHLVVDGKVGPAMPGRIVAPGFDAGASRLAFIDSADEAGWGRLVVADSTLARPAVVEQRATSLLVDAKRTRVAAITASGGQRRVVVVELARPGQPRRSPGQDDVSHLALSADGGSVAYIATRGGRRFVALDDREAPLAEGEEPVTGLVIRPDRRAVGVMVLAEGTVSLREFFGTGGVATRYEQAEGLAYSADGRHAAFAAQRGSKWCLVVDGREGQQFDRVVSPVFSPDGERVAYRARQGGTRFVVIADRDGKTVSIHPAYEHVYPVRFTPDGKSIAYGVKENGKFTSKVEPL